MLKDRFELIWKREIKELDSVATFYRYKKNGAQILSIQNKDENKVFGITFRTPPKDSTGVAHILEHSVLCGSKKYPLKEPFVELLKGSLQTFLNALTFPDKTSYPVASQNKTDFYNLIDVYLDAVFNPLLTKEIFFQEGWHLEIDPEDIKKSQIVGVVYNEMKGAYSSPDSMLIEYSQQSLFPGSPYGFDSGGHPDEIIKLSYEEFKNFHERYYHPSNSRIFFWGDDPEEERLEIIDRYLSKFDQQEIDSAIWSGQRFSGPKEFEYKYPSEGDGKSMITFNWLLEETSLLYVNFGLQILEYLLINMDSSVLKKNLIESGLGEGICGIGLEEDLKQMYFSTGLKGVCSKDFGKVWDVVLDTMEDVYKNGFDKDLVEAAINSFEFDLRELNSGNLPRGLVVMFRALTTWLYDEDPLLLLCFEKPLNFIKQNISEGERIFEELIAKYFLNNPHRTTVKLIPSEKLRDEIDKRELEKVHEVLSQIEDIEKYREQIESLKEYQKKQDLPEDLQRIPYVKTGDLSKEESDIPTKVERMGRSNVLYHDLFTNNILYLDIAFDLKYLPQRYINYVNLIGRAITEMGTSRHDYVSLDKLIQAKTGGIHHETFVSKHLETEKDVGYLIVRSKVMRDNLPWVFEILNEVLSDLYLKNKERFLQILMQEKAKIETGLIPAGHMVVSTRLKSKLDSSAWINEQIGGISYLLFLRYLIKEVENNFDKVAEDLEKIKGFLFNSTRITFNLTGSGNLLDKADIYLKELYDTLSPKRRSPHRMIYEVVSGNEGINIPAQVNYVGKGMNLTGVGYKFKGSHLVATRYLKNTYLWNKVRVEGGAYGAMVSLDRFSNILSFVSYRDPNTWDTLKVYDGASEFLKDIDISDSELEKAIVGTIGDIDRYRLPDAKGLLAMMRYLVGDNKDKRQKLRNEVLSCTRNDFKELGELISCLRDKGTVVILGYEKKISEVVEKGIEIPHRWSIK